MERLTLIECIELGIGYPLILGILIVGMNWIKSMLFEKRS